MLGVEFKYSGRTKRPNNMYSYTVNHTVKDRPDLSGPLGHVWAVMVPTPNREGGTTLEKRWTYLGAPGHSEDAYSDGRYKTRDAASRALAKMHYTRMYQNIKPEWGWQRGLPTLRGLISREAAQGIVGVYQRVTGHRMADYTARAFVSHLCGSTQGEFRVGGLYVGKIFHSSCGWIASTPAYYDTAVAQFVCAELNNELEALYRSYVSSEE